MERLRLKAFDAHLANELKEASLGVPASCLRAEAKVWTAVTNEVIHRFGAGLSERIGLSITLRLQSKAETSQAASHALQDLAEISWEHVSDRAFTTLYRPKRP